VLFAAIMILLLVVLPALQIILTFWGTVNVMCLVVPAAACVLILGSLEALLIAWWTQ
jgi:hypothetical protein